MSPDEMGQALQLARGNPGAITVLAQVAAEGELGRVARDLEAANAHGPCIWLLYKDIHNMDLKAFMESTDQIEALLSEHPTVKKEWDYYQASEEKCAQLRE